MSEYIQIEFQQITSVQSDILLAQLSSIGFEGFEEEENLLRAFIPSENFDEVLLKEITSFNNLSYTQSRIEETNWNAVWESNFDPVIVDDFVSIRADFHEPIKLVEHEIVITPKMSFGTGVLAILAETLGAEKIAAVDNDDWSIENAKENFEKNNCNKIDLQKAEDAGTGKQYDIILANINKNVILDNMSNLSQQLLSHGVLLLSGLLVEDETDIVKAAEKFKLKLARKTERNNWIALKFTY